MIRATVFLEKSDDKFGCGPFWIVPHCVNRKLVFVLTCGNDLLIWKGELSKCFSEVFYFEQFWNNCEKQITILDESSVKLVLVGRQGKEFSFVLE